MDFNPQLKFFLKHSFATSLVLFKHVIIIVTAKPASDPEAGPTRVWVCVSRLSSSVRFCCILGRYCRGSWGHFMPAFLISSARQVRGAQGLGLGTLGWTSAVEGPVACVPPPVPRPGAHLEPVALRGLFPLVGPGLLNPSRGELRSAHQGLSWFPATRPLPGSLGVRQMSWEGCPGAEPLTPSLSWLQIAGPPEPGGS